MTVDFFGWFLAGVPGGDLFVILDIGFLLGGLVDLSRGGPPFLPAWDCGEAFEE